MTKIKEIGHAVLHVSDVATSSDWYCDILGVEVVIAADGLPARFLSFGRKDHDLALFESGHCTWMCRCRGAHGSARAAIDLESIDG